MAMSECVPLHKCKKGAGTKENKFKDRCYWFYNGECIRPVKEPCLYRIETR